MKSIFPKSRKSTCLQASENFPNLVNHIYEDKLIAYKSAVDDTFLNLAWSEEINPAVIERVGKFFGKPHCFCLDTENKILVQQALNAGLVHIMNCPQFTLELENFLMPNQKLNTGHRIELVDQQNKKLMLEWCHTFCVGYDAYDAEYVYKFMQPILKNKNLFIVLAYQGDNPICTGMLEINNDIAGIGGIATKKEFRRQGFAREVSNFLLQVAKDQGCKTASLNAAPGADVLYYNLGFKVFLKEGLFASKQYIK